MNVRYTEVALRELDDILAFIGNRTSKHPLVSNHFHIYSKTNDWFRCCLIRSRSLNGKCTRSKVSGNPNALKWRLITAAFAPADQLAGARPPIKRDLPIGEAGKRRGNTDITMPDRVAATRAIAPLAKQVVSPGRRPNKFLSRTGPVNRRRGRTPQPRSMSEERAGQNVSEIA
jgi:hypothetical protein